MEQKDLLLGHMEDLAERAVKTGCAASRFLTPTEAQSVAAHFNRRRDVTVSFDGGCDNAERVRAVFLNTDWGSYEWSELFAALKIECRPQDVIGHRDVLGSLMALGIERETVSDISADKNPVMLVCLPELAAYIINNVSKIGRVGVSVSEVSLDQLPSRTEDLTIKTYTVASLRLDAVLCAAFGLSRTKAAELIAAGLVSLNYEPRLQTAKELSEGDLLSLRGYGRAKLLEVSGTSRKGRTFIQIGLYGK